MIQTIESEGKTVDAAIKKALQTLGLTEDEENYKVEVLALPKSGFLGFGAVPARIRMTFDDGKAEPRAPRAPKAPRQEKAPVRAEKPAEPKAEKSAPKQAAPAAAGDAVARTESFLRGLLERMGVECAVTASQTENGRIDVRLDGENMGAVIGRRGETLDAIQHLANYVVNRGNDKHMHISVDAEGYRSKREDSLVTLAHKMAAKTIKYKRSMALEPMNSYERHVIHTALQDYEGVTTSSIGTEPNRRVVVNYVRPEGESAEDGRRSRSRGDRNRSRGESRPARESAPVKEAAPAPEAEPAREAPQPKAQPEMPEGYTPPSKNKPTCREWC